MTLTTRMLTPETWDDFAALVEVNNGVWGGCWCMGFHPEGVGAGHTREGNREAKRRHVMCGTVRQVLVYDGERCVGWCQFGSPPELPNINNRGAYDRGAGDGVVEAYPEQTGQRPPQRGAYLHTGPEELYARYGFTRVRKIAKWRWVMRTKI